MKLNAETIFVLVLLLRITTWGSCIAAAIGAASLWHFRSEKSLPRYTGVVLAAATTMELCRQIARFHDITIRGWSLWYIAWILAGNTIWLIAVTRLVLYIVVIRRNGKQ